MPQYYTPFLSQAGGAIGQGLESKGLQQQQAMQNKMAGSAYLGDPEAMQELMQVNPQLGIQIQELHKKKKASLEQQELDKQASTDKRSTQFNKEYSDLMKRISNFETFEEAKQVGDAWFQDLVSRYPEISKKIGSPEFDEGDFQQAKTLAGKEDEGILTGKPNRKDFTKESWALYEETGKQSDLIVAPKDTDGTESKVQLKKMEDGFFHKFKDGVDLGKAAPEEGEATKFWAAEKEESIDERSKLRDEQRREKLTHQQSKEKVTQTTNLRKEYDQDIKTLEHMDQTIDSILIGLEEGGPLGDKAVKIGLSRLTNSKVRALAELQEYQNYGTAVGRITGWVSSQAFGEKTDEQKEYALSLVLSYRDKFVRPGLAAAKHYYRTLAKKDKLDLHSVARFSDQNDVKQALQAGQITEDEAVEIIQTIGFKP